MIVYDLTEIYIDSGRMYMINVNAFIEREQAMSMGKGDCGTNVLKFHDDEATGYAILSHQWIGEEVDYKEMIKLAKMKKSEQSAVRARDGYKKILASCEQAKRDGYEWLWVDMCCIDKRSSAELSEAINSMCRWYVNSKVCYAYLHDVTGTSFPKWSDNGAYPNSNRWPEWFLRGWTLQEMIAPSNLHFFNMDWQPIGNKRTLSPTLSAITRVPEHILRNGLSSNRSCVAQIMSWAADRTTTRVEDRAYSLLGLLDVNMLMLYGEGKKAFYRLQLEIIRTSNDQSIFAWRGNVRAGGVLADDPSFFQDCDEMELMGYDGFIQHLKAFKHIAREVLPSIDEDRFGIFPITNRGIQIWMFLRPYVGCDSVFEAWLPCRHSPSGEPVQITLTLWNSNYYRYFKPERRYPTGKTLRFRQVYLRYQDLGTLEHATFEIDDSATINGGFTHHHTYPHEHAGNTFTLTGTDSLCVKVYSDSKTHRFFAVCLGQCFGQDWIHVVCEESQRSLENYAKEEYFNVLARGSEHAKSMADVQVHSRGGRHGGVWVKHSCHPGSTWAVRISYVVWQNSRNCGVKIEVPRNPHNVRPNKWIGLVVEAGAHALSHWH
ncbi:heterokaryon incompatibility protein-domain-containing protein [Scleroderma yunnanense]